jgi:hypothetical protein
MPERKSETGTVRSAKEVAREKGNTKDYGSVSRSKDVTSPKTVKENPASKPSGKRAPGGDTEGV